MQGKIIKGIAGFYYIHIDEMGIYECKAKGIFRNQNIKPMVGDDVLADILDETEKKGNIVKILPRINQLVRPMVANVNQGMVIFAVDKPAPNLNLLDRFLVTMKQQDLDTIICFNKTDVVEQEDIDRLKAIYSGCGYHVLFTSLEFNEGLEDIDALLKNKTTVLAGPSGVGKSTLMNYLKPSANMEIGEISRKIHRGRHTTRHSELIYIRDKTYVIDTPGFTSLHLNDIDKDELKNYFGEFEEYCPYCRFSSCVHINEPDCGVKRALEEGDISAVRYENYVNIYNELKEQRRF